MRLASFKKYVLNITLLSVSAIFVVQSAISLSPQKIYAEINDQGSGWDECNGWTDPRYRDNTGEPIPLEKPGNFVGGLIPCRNRALEYAQTGNYYNSGLPLPPSGDKNSATPGTDQEWYNWGLTKPSGRKFLSEGTSCGIGPNAEGCQPIPTNTPTNTPKPSATPTSTPRPSATPTSTPKPSATPTNTPKPTVTVTIKPSVTPSITITPTPEVKGEETVFGFNIRKAVEGKLSYKVGELITFKVTLENSGTEVINKINMRDIYVTDMRVEAVYMVRNGQRTNISSQILTNGKNGNISPTDPKKPTSALNLIDLTSPLKAGDKVIFEFIFKAVGANTQACNQAFASANNRGESSSSKTCVNIYAEVPVTD